MEQLIEALTTFAQQLLLVSLPVLAAAGVGYVLVKWQEVRASLPAKDLMLLEYVCGLAVAAAEKAKLSGLIQDKKEEAIKFAQSYLNSRGVHIDVGIIAMAIEAAVLKQFPKKTE